MEPKSRDTAQIQVAPNWTRVGGSHQTWGHDGNLYSVSKDYGVGTTFRGWSAFRYDGARWVGTRFSGHTLREVKRQMTEAGIA